jgi:hypothetical protein
MQINQIARRVCALEQSSTYEEVGNVLGDILRSVTSAPSMSDHDALRTLDTLCLAFKRYHASGASSLTPERVQSFVAAHARRAPMLSVYVDQEIEEFLIVFGYVCNGSLRVAEIDVTLANINETSREFRRQIDALGPQEPIPLLDIGSDAGFEMQTPEGNWRLIHHIHHFSVSSAPTMRWWSGPLTPGWQMRAFLGFIMQLRPMANRTAFFAENGREGFERLANSIRAWLGDR